MNILSHSRQRVAPTVAAALCAIGLLAQAFLPQPAWAADPVQVSRYDDADEYLPTAERKNRDGVRLFLRQQEGEQLFKVMTPRNVSVDVVARIPEGADVGVYALGEGTTGFDQFAEVQAHDEAHLLAELERLQEVAEEAGERCFDVEPGRAEVGQAAAGGDAVGRVLDVTEGFAEDGLIEPGLVAEIVGNGAQIDPGGVGDDAGRGLLKAFFGEQAQGRVEEALAGQGAVGADGGMGSGCVHEADSVN